MNYCNRMVLFNVLFLRISFVIKHPKRILITLLVIFSYNPAIANKQLLTLDIATTQAVRDNPGLAEIKARYDALAAIPSQAGSLPDPELSINALNLPTDTFSLDQEPMTQIQMGFSQGELKLILS